MGFTLEIDVDDEIEFGKEIERKRITDADRLQGASIDDNV